MKHYKALINGSNCMLKAYGEDRRFAFYVTVFVAVEWEHEAASEALSAIRQRLAEKIRNPTGDVPEIAVVELQPVEPSDIPEVAPGFAWCLSWSSASFPS